MIVKSVIKIHSAAGVREIPVEYQSDQAILTSPPCPGAGHTGEPSVQVTVSKVAAAALAEGAYIQRALSTLDSDTRERFITGICPSCWDALFGSD